MKIYVKTLVGQTHELEIEPSQSILSVKEKLGEPSQIRLMAGGCCSKIVCAYLTME